MYFNNLCFIYNLKQIKFIYILKGSTEGFVHIINLAYITFMYFFLGVGIIFWFMKWYK